MERGDCHSDQIARVEVIYYRRVLYGAALVQLVHLAVSCDRELSNAADEGLHTRHELKVFKDLRANKHQLRSTLN